MADQFEHAMRLMHSHNPQIRQDGLDQLRLHVAQHLEELITEFNRETDHDLRCALLELIGEARSADVLSVLVEQLHGGDESLRSGPSEASSSSIPKQRVTSYTAPELPA